MYIFQKQWSTLDDENFRIIVTPYTVLKMWQCRGTCPYIQEWLNEVCVVLLRYTITPPGKYLYRKLPALSVELVMLPVDFVLRVHFPFCYIPRFYRVQLPRLYYQNMRCKRTPGRQFKSNSKFRKAQFPSIFFTFEKRSKWSSCT